MVGIISQGAKKAGFGVSVTIPGTILKWVLAEGGKEVDDCLVKN